MKESPKNLTQEPKQKADPRNVERIKEMREKDRTMVRGKFIFHEVPGGQMGFVYKKYKGDPLEKYEMRDGQIYTIPLGVAKHLNTNCSYPSYTFKNDDAGRPVVTVAENIRRCSFQSLEFFDDASPTSVYRESATSGAAIGSALPK